MALALAPITLNAFNAPTFAVGATRANVAMTTLTPGGKAFAEKLPGVTGPFGYFDPLDLTPDTAEEVMLFREAELTHGRVAMMAALGYLVQENFHPIFNIPDMQDLPVIRQLDVTLSFETGQLAGVSLLLAIFFSEIYRARTGWMEPEVEMRSLRENYTPGELNFDPMGLLPKDEAGILSMKNKELNNGRLAMIGVAGMTVQELVTGDKLF